LAEQGDSQDMPAVERVVRICMLGLRPFQPVGE
jgi:hypothetical protein